MPTSTIDSPPQPLVLPAEPFSALVRPAPKPRRHRPKRRRRRRPAREPRRRAPRTPRQIDALGPARRLELYRGGELTRQECVIWAGRYPEEIPLINGEIEWIALSLADLD